MMKFLRRGRAVRLGLCPWCRLTVFHDDDYRLTATGVAHEDCAKWAVRA